MAASLLPSSVNREQLEAILNLVADPLFTTDVNFVITAFNPAAEQLTGYARDQALGRRCAEVFRSGICGGARCLGRQVFETGRGVSDRRVTIRDRFDAPRPVRMSACPLWDASGALAGQAQTFYPLNGNGKSRRAAAEDRAAGLTILEVSARRTIEDVLRRHHWNRAEACRELGLSRTTLWRKMRRLGIRGGPQR